MTLSKTNMLGKENIVHPAKMHNEYKKAAPPVRPGEN
jgi:hypothetical protein